MNQKVVTGSPIDPSGLQRMYGARFAGKTQYRIRVWHILVSYFSQWVPPSAAVLDLGAGFCEFINTVTARVKYAMDLNPEVRNRAASTVNVLQQDCSEPWTLEQETLDVVFTSNFLEHLPDKNAVRNALANAYHCLKPGGRFIAMGPNIKYLPGAHWDFFDHHVELTEMSLAEALTNSGFHIEKRVARFLPYTMSNGREYPLWILQLYLAFPPAWPIFGKQFLVIGTKPLLPEDSNVAR